jgi:hypothetical protein
MPANMKAIRRQDTSGRLVLVLAAGALALAQARATPLDAETCGRLKGEQTQLENAGAGHNMAKGPQWAKANLGPDKIEQVRRLIEVEEQLLFRCTGRSLVQLPPEPDPDPAAASTEPGEEGKDTLDAPGGTEKKATVPPVGKLQSDHPKNAPEAGKSSAAPAKGPEPKTTGPEPKTKGPEPKAKKAVEGKGAAAAKQAKQEGTKAPATKTAKPAPKAKADDSFKPPPPDPAANPFASKQAPPTKQ